MTGDSMVAEATAGREIILTRTFNAPRALVWEVWTDPAHVAQWWGPKGFESTGCEMDLRAGGGFRLGLLGPDGLTYPCSGVFREIVAPERIVYEGPPEEGHPCGSGVPPRAIVTVTFDEHEGRTTLTIAAIMASVADRVAAADGGYVEGWTSSLERLEAHLDSRAQ